MKAVLCKQPGPPSALVLESVASPQPGPGQLVVQMKAAGVNFPDVLIIQGNISTSLRCHLLQVRKRQVS